MIRFLDILRYNKYYYIITLSLVTTIIIINETVNFTERIIRHPMLLFGGLMVFFILVRTAFKEELWKNEK